MLGVPVRPAFAVDGFTRREETTITGGAIILTPRERKPSARAVADNGVVVTRAARKGTTAARKGTTGGPGVTAGKGKKVVKNKVVSETAAGGVRNDTGARIHFPPEEMATLLIIIKEFTCPISTIYPAGIKWAFIATAVVKGGPNGKWGVLYRRKMNCTSHKMSDKGKCLSKKFWQTPEGKEHRIKAGLMINRRYR